MVKHPGVTANDFLARGRSWRRAVDRRWRSAWTKELRKSEWGSVAVIDLANLQPKTNSPTLTNERRHHA
jgi:hypothetical protein